MAVTPVTPVPGLVSQIVTGGSPVVACGAAPSGGYITNPYSASDQGLGAPENLYIDPTGANATLVGNGTTFCLYPGQTWQIIPGQTTTTSVNAASSGHKFSIVTY